MLNIISCRRSFKRKTWSQNSYLDILIDTNVDIEA